MTFENARSTQTTAVESATGNAAASDGWHLQIAIVECWPGGPIVSDRGQCPPPGERDKTRITPELPMLPQAIVGTSTIDFGSAHSGAMTMAANETKPGDGAVKPVPIQPPLTYNRPYRINGDGTVEMGRGPTQGPASWQNPNNK